MLYIASRRDLLHLAISFQRNPPLRIWWSRPRSAVSSRAHQQPLIKPYVRISRIRLPSKFAVQTLNQLAEAPPGEGWVPLPGRVRHVFTHMVLETSLLRAQEAAETSLVRGRAAGDVESLWRRQDQLAELALPTFTRKLLRHAGFEA